MFQWLQAVLPVLYMATTVLLASDIKCITFAELNLVLALSLHLWTNKVRMKANKHYLFIIYLTCIVCLKTEDKIKSNESPNFLNGLF